MKNRGVCLRELGRYARTALVVLCWLQFACGQSALAQASPINTKTEVGIWMPALAALIGGLLSGILGPLLKDVVILRWNERRSDRKLQQQIEESYFAPLSASAEKLTWRISEILLARRSHFLMLTTQPKEYNEYKRLSTLYRIASLLGWVRAINLELSALPRGGFGADSPMFKALYQVQSALADGHRVEERRLRSFCDVCSIDLKSLPKNKLDSLAADFEVELYALAGGELRENHRYLLDSKLLHQDYVCRGLCEFLKSRQLQCSLDATSLANATKALIGTLGYREALVYREWQDAIGDAMIATDEHAAARRYRIIGFEEFERIMTSETFSWIRPLREFIEDVDLISPEPDPADERPKHLRDLAEGIGAILEAISVSSRGKLVNPDALQRARQIRAS